METLIYVSLIVNVVVLTPILIFMARNSPRVVWAWGDFTPARGILFSIYFAIFVASVLLLIQPVPAFVFVVLLMQVIYKVTTPLTVRSLKNPIVLSNLAISVLHVATLVNIYPAIEYLLAA